MQRFIGPAFAVLVGLAVAWVAYDRASDPERGLKRQEEERIVRVARRHLMEAAALTDASEVVDPLAPNRIAGKVYIYPDDGAWEVSGYYRRAAGAPWMPWLMRLDADRILMLTLSADDRAAHELAAEHPLISLQ